jgi:hypothetical protein
MQRFPFFARFAALGLFCLALSLALVACGGSAAPTNTAAPAANAIPNAFVGTIPGTDAMIALTTTNGTSLSYVCDSKQVSTWFSGPVSANALDITAANGNHLKATLAASGATGTVTLGGKDFPFTAAPAKGDAGLFRAEQEINGGKLVGGWIVNTDGQQRGAINTPRENRDEISPAPQLVVAQKASPTTWTVQTPNFGLLTVKRVVDPEDHRG